MGVHKGIGKYQSMEKMTKEQREYWNKLPMKIRNAIRNGIEPGMSKEQLRYW